MKYIKSTRLTNERMSSLYLHIKEIIIHLLMKLGRANKYDFTI